MKLTILFLLAVAVTTCQVEAQKTTTKTTASAPKKGAQKQSTKAPTKAPAADNKNKDNQVQRKHKNAKAGSQPNKIYHNCFCDNVVGKKDLKVESLKGTWYVRNQQSALSFYPFTGDCAYGNVTFVDDKTLTLSTKSHFHVSKIQSTTKLNYIKDGVFNWTLSTLIVDNSTVPVNSTLKLAVVDVDYKNFTILYICGNYNLGGISAQAAAATATNSNDKYVPPSAFVLLSRERDSKFRMRDFNKTISALYDCYHNMHTKTNQGNDVCKTKY